ncbi:DNA-binding transcriptional repressor ExuR [Escherichia coli]|nr:DNA-binding transcriptional repressor ExuR [Escherichia coli]
MTTIQILKALIRKDPHAAKLAMWQHLENTKIMLFNETSDDFEFNADRYLFAEKPGSASRYGHQWQ